MKDLTQSFNSIFRWQLFSTVVIAIIQLITIILLGRLLEYKELGSFALFQLVFRFALYCLDPGMFFSIVQKHDSNVFLVRKLFSIQGIYLLCSMVVLAILSQISESFKDLTALLLCNGFVILIIIGIGAYSQAELMKQFRQKEVAIAQTLSYIVELLFVLVFCSQYNPILIFSYGILIRFLVFYGICYYYIYSYDNISGNLISNSETTKEHIHQSNFNIASQILSYFQGQYDTFVIVSLFGLPVLGAYILTTEISYVIFSKINPLFNKAIFPVISKSFKENSKVSSLITESFSSYLILIVICYAIFWIYRLDIFTWAYQDKATELAHYAMYLLPIALSKAINNILNSYILALGEAKKIFVWNIVLLILNYSIFGLFYWMNWSMDLFLVFITVYSILIMFLAYLFLLWILKKNSIHDFVLDGNPLLNMILIIISIFFISRFILDPVLSISLSVVFTIFLLYILERRRFLNWLKFSIV